MIRLLIHAAIFLATPAIGLVVAYLLLPDFQLSVSGFLIAVVVFAVAQSILAPFIAKLTQKYASALLGGVGLLATFVALLLASLVPGGLSISGASTWALGTIIVWLITALGTWLLPLIFLRNRVRDRRADSAEA